MAPVSSPTQSHFSLGSSDPRESRKKRSSILTGFFTTREPSTQAFREYQKDQARLAAEADQKRPSRTSARPGGILVRPPTSGSQGSSRWLGVPPSPKLPSPAGSDPEVRCKSREKLASIEATRPYPSQQSGAGSVHSSSTLNSNSSLSFTSSNSSKERLGSKMAVGPDSHAPTPSESVADAKGMTTADDTSVDLPAKPSTSSHPSVHLSVTAATSIEPKRPNMLTMSVKGAGARDRSITPWDFMEPVEEVNVITCNAMKSANRSSVWSRPK
ncbi:MAG: hypothetical protein M1838_000527 [Thelocarpon superellum]|nr:MAG: hypothetical protein M1838_000527 [Thelocarpon superellum]